MAHVESPGVLPRLPSRFSASRQVGVIYPFAEIELLAIM
jgi:hypothetical protein